MPKPKIGLSMLYMLSESFDRMNNELPKAETNYIEVVDDGSHTLSKKRVQTLREAAKNYNLKYSVHAPFADVNIASPSETMLKAALKRLHESMQFAVDLDSYLWVFHPGGKSGISAFYPGADWKQNSESIMQIHKWASEYGLKIAMENLPEKYNFLMKTPQDFQRFYKETGLEDIGIVLDTGHAHLEGQITPFLEQVPNKIAHIHISDNHGVIDEHLGLGYGTINWDQFVVKIKKIGFNGTVLTESVYQAQETLQRLKILFA
jgi:sugar phosphate isomerase/epimerase